MLSDGHFSLKLKNKEEVSPLFFVPICYPNTLIFLILYTYCMVSCKIFSYMNDCGSFPVMLAIILGKVEEVFLDVVSLISASSNVKSSSCAQLVELI
jgi:hypothetical protein